MGEETLTGAIKTFNSFDYIFIAYTLWQIYLGYTQGFRLMLYQTVKWILLFAGLFVANRHFLPVLMKREWFIEKSQAINRFGYDFVVELAPDDNPFSEIIYRQVAESIPFDKIVFFLAVIIIVSLITRIIIIGSLWGKEPEARKLGVMFGLFKAAFVCFIVMTFIGTFMNISNPEGFLKWQEQSFILSKIPIRF